MNPLRAFDLFRLGAARSTDIRQPIAVVSPLTGAVFVTADGKVLTRGYRRVKPLKPSTSPVVEYATADGAFYATADGNIYSTGAA